jgi:hypothetical protein
MKYCCKQAQINDWKRHKLECKIMSDKGDIFASTYATKGTIANENFDAANAAANVANAVSLLQEMNKNNESIKNSYLSKVKQIITVGGDNDNKKPKQIIAIGDGKDDTKPKLFLKSSYTSSPNNLKDVVSILENNNHNNNNNTIIVTAGMASEVKDDESYKDRKGFKCKGGRYYI